MRTTLIACCLSLSMAAIASAQAIPEPVVAVSGESVIKAAPDQAFVTLAAESRSRNPKEAQAQNAKAMTAVQQALASAGIPNEAVRTLSAELTMESDWVNGRQIPRGYVARNIIEVRLDAVGRVGEVMDLAVTSGATNVHGVRFDLKQRESLEREALKRATADALTRAEAAAAGAGRTIGRVIRIEEPGTRPGPGPQSMMMAREAVAAAGAQTPVVAGEIEIRARILLTATLK